MKDSMFKRFRDSVTGLFVSKADADRRPRETEEEVVSTTVVKMRQRDRRNLLEHIHLKKALDRVHSQPSIDYPEAYRALRNAIVDVLDKETPLP